MSLVPRGGWAFDLVRLLAWLLLGRLLSGVWSIDLLTLTAIGTVLSETFGASVAEWGLLLCCLFLLRMLGDGFVNGSVDASAGAFALQLLHLAWLPAILLTGGWLLLLLLPVFAREDGLYRRLFLKRSSRFFESSTIR